MLCPRCGSDHVVKNGSKCVMGEQRQSYLCRSCKYATVNPLRDSDRELMEYSVKLAKNRQRLQDTNRIERKAFREHARLENAVSEYNDKLIKVLSKHSIKKTIKKHKNTRQKTSPIIQISDIHFNELVDMKHNQYNFSVASKRLRKYCARIKEHLKPFNITNCLVAMTGDLMNSDRRLDELLNSSTNRSNATFMAVDILKSFILDLNKSFNVEVISVSGNESRMAQHMGYTDILATDNYDFTIFNILKYILDDGKGIKFISGDPIEQVACINGLNILFMHGIDMPHNPCEAIHKLRGRYAARGVNISYVIFGHVHECLIADLYARSSSLVGANAYSDKKLNLTSRASQNLYLVYNNNIDGTRIDLQDTNNNGYEFTNINDAYNPKSESKMRKKRTIIEITV